jgi:hypothetical protein
MNECAGCGKPMYGNVYPISSTIGCCTAECRENFWREVLAVVKERRATVTR